MQILTIENTYYDLNQLPDIVDDMRYCVLDYSDQDEADYIWQPLVFLDIFPSACADIKIGPYAIQAPLDWSIVIGDKHSGNLEIMRLIDLNDKDFDVFVFNPLTGYMPEFHTLEIRNVFPDVKWCFPKLKLGHFLAVPLVNKPKPPCVFMIKDTAKSTDNLDIRNFC
jgi:hypothetical protein